MPPMQFQMANRRFQRATDEVKPCIGASGNLVILPLILRNVKLSGVYSDHSSQPENACSKSVKKHNNVQSDIVLMSVY